MEKYCTGVLLRTDLTGYGHSTLLGKIGWSAEYPIFWFAIAHWAIFFKRLLLQNLFQSIVLFVSRDPSRQGNFKVCNMLAAATLVSPRLFFCKHLSLVVNKLRLIHKNSNHTWNVTVICDCIMTFWQILIQYYKFLVPRTLKWGILGASTHCSRIDGYPNFIAHVFFHFSWFIHNVDNQNM